LRYPGVNGQEYYSEGIFVGYRWYDQQRIAPLYPFGYGLSYTSFGYRHLRVLGAKQGIPRVRFTLTNTGRRTGTEVAQVYVGRLPTSLPTPVKQLAGVARVTLGPSQSRTVTVSLDRRSLSYWDSQADRWVTPAGQVAVLVGSSSRNIQLRGTLTIRHKHG
jgi:beta-glucosidase